MPDLFHRQSIDIAQELLVASVVVLPNLQGCALELAEVLIA
jgi:hypothetical protein